MIEVLPNTIFIILLLFGIGFFVRNIRKLVHNINLGKPLPKLDNKRQRLLNMLRIAVGQSKMTVRPISGVLHILVYLGFIIINIEVLEIILDGILGTHRLFSFMGGVYDLFIGVFEVLALLVIVAVILFWIRRNIIKINRFEKKEMEGWAKKDANYILYFELVLMSLFLTMDACDYLLQERNVENYTHAGSFIISSHWAVVFSDMKTSALILLERFCWWGHILGIIIFLNYLYYSKHLHIILAFPNTFFASLLPKGNLGNLPSVTKEVKAMLGLTNATDNNQSVDKFGASEITDLTRVQIMNAYTCTECGRCTDECPANKTGKKLSPRKIMMSVRDCAQDFEINKGKDKHLLGDYITSEELWACTTCNACVEACPVAIDPLSIIMDMRQFLVMEQSEAPLELNNMMSNIENNGAPWPYNNSDRLQWNN